MWWSITHPQFAFCRMLKKSASFVLASFRSSTYPRGYASDLHLLRPCRTNFLSILQGCVLLSWAGRPTPFSSIISGSARLAFSPGKTSNFPSAMLFVLA